MTNKFSISLLAVATVFVLLFSGCKKDDPNVAIWTLSSVAGTQTTTTTGAFNNVTTATSSLSAGVLSTTTTTTNPVSSFTNIANAYSLKINIQKGGMLTITEVYTPNVLGATAITKTWDGYWEYLNNTATNDIILLNGLSNTQAAMSSQYKISQSSGTLTLTNNSDSKTSNFNSSTATTTTETLSFTK